jgi:DNA-binding protein Fis
MTKKIMTREIRDGWELQCARYQSMKHRVMLVLEHPDSTEEQMMEAAALLRSARTHMTAMRESLSNLFSGYFVTLDGWKVKQVHGMVFAYETRQGKLERLLKEDAEAKTPTTV